MFTGIQVGVATAVLQALSYEFSAGFIHSYHSPLQLLAFSQLVMGIFCLPLAFFLYPSGLEEQEWDFALKTGIWIAAYAVGQTAFFSMLRTIEPSRGASLLGLKIIVLALISVFILHQGLSLQKRVAVFISSLAAVMINWSGGCKFSRSGIFWLVMTLIFYSLADVSATHLVILIRHHT